VVGCDAIHIRRLGDGDIRDEERGERGGERRKVK
tara:strand:+ start:6636 stop:6737 length:102 start_codon:yes stop_codon:yes gene_type:complete